MGNLWAVYALFITTLLIIALLFSYYVYLAKPNGIKKSIYETKEKLNELSPTIKFLLLVSVILVILSFWMPFFLTKNAFIEEFDFSKTGNIGDTFGGILNPFIAMAAVIVTGLAFYMQYQANKQVQDQFKLQQFESQFYEMLRLYKENINEFYIEGYIFQGNESFFKEKIDKDTSGRKVIVTMLSELSSIYLVVKKAYLEVEKKQLGYNYNGFYIWDIEDRKKYFELSYLIFFEGYDSFRNKVINNLLQYNKELLTYVSKELIHFRERHSSGDKYFENYIALELEKTFVSKKLIIKDAETYPLSQPLKLYFNYRPFSGHQSRLGHYFRGLYALVKNVATYDEVKLDYDEKRRYINIIRTQISNHEFVLLYYNWLSTYGINWESTNRYSLFVDYRFLHNLQADLLLEELHPEYYLKYNTQKVLVKSNHTLVQDPIFDNIHNYEQTNTLR